MYLNEIKKYKEYTIKNINANELIKRRLYDIGIIKDSIISIRNNDAKYIEVYDD